MKIEGQEDLPDQELIEQTVRGYPVLRVIGLQPTDPPTESVGLNLTRPNLVNSWPMPSNSYGELIIEHRRQMRTPWEQEANMEEDEALRHLFIQVYWQYTGLKATINNNSCMTNKPDTIDAQFGKRLLNQHKEISTAAKTCAVYRVAELGKLDKNGGMSVVLNIFLNELKAKSDPSVIPPNLQSLAARFQSLYSESSKTLGDIYDALQEGIKELCYQDTQNELVRSGLINPSNLDELQDFLAFQLADVTGLLLVHKHSINAKAIRPFGTSVNRQVSPIFLPKLAQVYIAFYNPFYLAYTLDKIDSVYTREAVAQAFEDLNRFLKRQLNYISNEGLQTTVILELEKLTPQLADLEIFYNNTRILDRANIQQRYLEVRSVLRDALNRQ